EADVVVPGGGGSAAAVLCEGAPGGVCAVRGSIRGFRGGDRQLVYVAEGLGGGGRACRGERQSRRGVGEAERVRGGRPGWPANAAPGFGSGAVVRRCSTR